MEIMSASEGKIANTSMRKTKNAISLKTAKSIYANLDIIENGPDLSTKGSNNHRKLYIQKIRWSDRKLPVIW
jgi:hypothetical protein